MWAPGGSRVREAVLLPQAHQTGPPTPNRGCAGFCRLQLGAFFALGRPSVLATRMDETDQNAFTPEGAPGTSKQGQRGPVQQGKTKVSGRASAHAGGVSINMNTCISSLSK